MLCLRECWKFWLNSFPPLSVHTSWILLTNVPCTIMMVMMMMKAYELRFVSDNSWIGLDMPPSLLLLHVLYIGFILDLFYGTRERRRDREIFIWHENQMVITREGFGLKHTTNAWQLENKVPPERNVNLITIPAPSPCLWRAPRKYTKGLKVVAKWLPPPIPSYCLFSRFSPFTVCEHEVHTSTSSVPEQIKECIENDYKQLHTVLRNYIQISWHDIVGCCTDITWEFKTGKLGLKILCVL